MIRTLKIKGLRGFNTKQIIRLAIPNGEDGSGITFLVGGNNTGKTTILEALKCFNNWDSYNVSFSEGQRNKLAKERVSLEITTNTKQSYKIETVLDGGSSTTKTHTGIGPTPPQIFIVPSRRFSEYEFGMNQMDRYNYINNQNSYGYNPRSAIMQQFSSRIFQFYQNKENFDPLLQKILGYDLSWTIEQNDHGNYYLKVKFGGCSHTCEGLGDGIWSVFTICDALYDSNPGDIIAIDEPELSLHPMFQKRVLALLVEYAKDRQIIINTHSPYFIDIKALANGANLNRLTKTNSKIQSYRLSTEAKKGLVSFFNNINQPHTLGIDAKEVFFLEDYIIVTEGQEDVILYGKATLNLNIKLNGTFFGWGSGGAENVKRILKILQDLGYQKVVAIFDGDKRAVMEDTQKLFPNYQCYIITEDDIRDKPAEKAKKAKNGLMKKDGTVKPAHEQEIKELFKKINNHFQS